MGVKGFLKKVKKYFIKVIVFLYCVCYNKVVEIIKTITAVGVVFVAELKACIKITDTL